MHRPRSQLPASLRRSTASFSCGAVDASLDCGDESPPDAVAELIWRISEPRLESDMKDEDALLIRTSRSDETPDQLIELVAVRRVEPMRASGEYLAPSLIDFDRGQRQGLTAVAPADS
jgi:hypothetical protein